MVDDSAAAAESETPAESLAAMLSHARKVRRGGQGKNAQKREARAAEKHNRSLAKPVRVERRGVQERFKAKPVSGKWFDTARPFLVIGRVGNVPQDNMARLLLWFRANAAADLGIAVSEEDQTAAAGINLMDLVPRAAILPLCTFSDKAEAAAFAAKVVGEFGCNAQVIQCGTWNVVPPYTAQGVTYPDKEFAQYMKQYASNERFNRAGFEDRIRKLKKDHMLSGQMRDTVSQEQIQAELDERKQRETVERELSSIALDVPAAADKVETVKDQLAHMIREHVRNEAVVSRYREKIKAIEAHLQELHAQQDLSERMQRVLRRDYDRGDLPVSEEALQLALEAASDIVGPVYCDPSGQWHGVRCGPDGSRVPVDISPATARRVKTGGGSVDLSEDGESPSGREEEEDMLRNRKSAEEMLGPGNESVDTEGFYAVMGEHNARAREMARREMNTDE